LCDADSIAESSGKAFSVGAINLFAVTKGGQIYLYHNRCPHAGAPLNWAPDRFLDRDGELIICSSHGALFHIESGRCVAGPCPGRYLQTIDYQIDADNHITLQPTPEGH